VSGLLGTLVDMARVARSEVAPEVTVPADASDEGSPSDASGASSVGRRRPPRPRGGELDDSSWDGSWAGETRNDHDQLVDAASESAARDASSVDPVAAENIFDIASESALAENAAVAGIAAERTPLTDRERAMLEFERFWWRHAGSKEQAIRETFDLSATHYYRLLNALLDQPAAVEFDPLVVGRLRRLRASRARRRAGR
jgi:hypothetical protein